MLHQVKHVLVVQQANQVEGTEAGSAAQGQVPDYHRAVETWRNITSVLLPSKQMGSIWIWPFFLQTYRRTTWAGTVELPWGSWAGVRKAWAPEWPRSPARLPTAPESFAAVVWPWSPAPSAGPLPPHTDTPTMPAPTQQHRGRTEGSRLCEWMIGKEQSVNTKSPLTCTLAKSTRLRSLSIWLICDVFCNTARAAWARWFRDVYLRRVCAKALTAAIWENKQRLTSSTEGTHSFQNWRKNSTVACFNSCRISGSQP